MKIRKRSLTQILLVIMVIGMPLRPIITEDGYNILATILLLYTIFFTKPPIKFNISIFWLIIFLLYCASSLLYAPFTMGVGWALRQMYPTYILSICTIILLENFFVNKEERVLVVESLFNSYRVVVILITIGLLIFEMPMLGGGGRLGKIFYLAEGQTVYSYHLYIAIGYTIYLMLFKCNKKIKEIYYFACLIFLIYSALLTSMRKLIVFFTGFYVLCIFYKSKNSIRKQIINIFYILVLATIAYFLIFRYEPIYLIIGRRVEALINGLLYNNYTISGFTDVSGVDRARLRADAINLFLQRPIFGYGLDTAKFFTSIKGARSVHMHNNYLELLASTGVVGFLLFYSGIFILIFKIIKILFKKNENHLFMFAAFLIMFQIQAYGEVSYFQGPHMLVYSLGIVSINCYNSIYSERQARQKIAGMELV